MHYASKPCEPYWSLRIRRLGSHPFFWQFVSLYSRFFRSFIFPRVQLPVRPYLHAFMPPSVSTSVCSHRPIHFLFNIYIALWAHLFILLFQRTLPLFYFGVIWRQFRLPFLLPSFHAFICPSFPYFAYLYLQVLIAVFIYMSICSHVNLPLVRLSPRLSMYSFIGCQLLPTCFHW